MATTNPTLTTLPVQWVAPFVRVSQDQIRRRIALYIQQHPHVPFNVIADKLGCHGIENRP